MKVLDYSTVSSINDLASEYIKWDKSLWSSDRKLYNKIKNIRANPTDHVDVRSNMTDLKDMLRAKVMMSDELSVPAAASTLRRFKLNFNSVKVVINDHAKDAEQHLKFIEDLSERADSIAVMIELTDHEDSIWNNIY